MRRIVTALAAALVVLLLLMAAAGVAYVKWTGLDARGAPGPIETRVARAVRSLAVPAAVRDRRNPVQPTPDVLVEGMEHFADHCAACHATDGSGNTEMGRGLFPKAPDMRLPATQSLTDGELFYIIEHGVRFTGMPGWSTGTPDGERSTWHLVHVIRHLPSLSPDEIARMQELMPQSPAAVRQEIEEEQFLQGGGEPAASAHPPSEPVSDAHKGAH